MHVADIGFLLFDSMLNYAEVYRIAMLDDILNIIWKQCILIQIFSKDIFMISIVWFFMCVQRVTNHCNRPIVCWIMNRINNQKKTVCS